MSSPLRVAVIGTGPSGLASLRFLSQDPEKFNIDAFEKGREVGGVWNYTDDTETDHHGLPCFASMYKDLRINFPREVVNFADMDFPQELPSYVHHSEVKKYIDRYADRFGLLQYIKFETMVVNVKPSKTASGTSWLVTTRDLITEDIKVSVYDAVIVCSGKQNTPYTPDIPGRDTFKGQILHSKNYRDRTHYQDKTVVILGASHSGLDLFYDMVPVVNKIYIAHTLDKMKSPIPANAEEVPAITKILPNGVLLQNGECREVDVIIFATGYIYEYPFLSEECQISIKDKRVQPLYRHIFNINHPTLCFVGLTQGLEFRVCAVQAEYVCEVLKGVATLPSVEEMLREEEEEYQRRVVAKNYHPKVMHILHIDSELFSYWNKIASETKVKPYPPFAKKLFDYALDQYAHHYDVYKTKNLRVIGQEDIEEI